MGKKNISSKFRIYHRYLGFFLAGIMAMYAISGVIMIFRTTDFLKKEKQIEKKIQPNLSAEELAKALFIRNINVTEETDEIIQFSEGSYNKTTGVASYTTKELPVVLQKFEKIHKATSNSPLFYLNIFFGISLLFFAVSSFFMFVKKSKALKTGIYVACAGVVLVIVMMFL